MDFDRQLAAVTALETRPRRSGVSRKGAGRSVYDDLPLRTNARAPAEKRTREPSYPGSVSKPGKSTIALDFDAQMKKVCRIAHSNRHEHNRESTSARARTEPKPHTRFNDQMPAYPVAPVLPPAVAVAVAKSSSVPDAACVARRKDDVADFHGHARVTASSPVLPKSVRSGQIPHLPHLPHLARHGVSPDLAAAPADSPPGIPDWASGALFGNVRAVRTVDDAFAQQSSALLLGPSGTGKSLSADLAARHYGTKSVIRVLDNKSANTMRGVEKILSQSLRRPLCGPVAVICDPIEALADEGFAFATQTQEKLDAMPTADVLVGRFRDAIAAFTPLNNVVLVLIANTLPPAWGPVRKSVQHIAYFERLPRQVCDFVCEKTLDAHAWSVFSRSDAFAPADAARTPIAAHRRSAIDACRLALEDYCGTAGTHISPRDAKVSSCADPLAIVAERSNTEALVRLHSRARLRADMYTNRREAAVPGRPVTEAEFRAAIATVCGGDARLVQSTTRFMLLANDARGFRASARRFVRERNVLSCPTDNGLLYTMIRAMLLASGANATVSTTMSIMTRADIPRRKVLTIMHAFMAEWDTVAEARCAPASARSIMCTAAGCMDDLCRLDCLARCHDVPNDVLYAYAASVTGRAAHASVDANRALTQRLMDAQMRVEPDASSFGTAWSIAYRPSAAMRFGLRSASGAHSGAPFSAHTRDGTV